MNLNIKIVDACNLQCPSCPRGRGDFPATNRQMDKEMLRAILEKAKKETHFHEIQLYDAEEPTLHKDLPGMLRLAGEYGPTTISTNASRKGVDWLAIMESGLKVLVVTISGITQTTHGKGNRGSNLDTVKENLEQIRNIRLINPNIKTKVWVYYLRYKYNLEEEPLARTYVESLGFNFIPVWAVVLREDGHGNTCDCVLSPDQGRLVGALHPIKYCYILERNLNIDITGEAVQCPVWRQVKGNYLTEPLSVIQERRRKDPICINCRKTGMAAYVCRNPILDYYHAKMVGDKLEYKIQRWRHWAYYLREVWTR